MHKNRHTDSLAGRLNSIFRWLHEHTVLSGKFLFKPKLENCILVLKETLLGHFSFRHLLDPNWFRSSDDDLMHNKIVNVKTNDKIATIKYFSNLVRVRHNVMP